MGGLTITPRFASLPLGTDRLSPAFAVYLDGEEIPADVSKHIISVEYESTVDMADVMRLTVENADHQFTDSRVFEPGLSIEVWMGYGDTLRFIGRTEIVRHLPVFPLGDVPTLEIVGYGPEARLGRQEMAVTGEKPKKRGGQASGDKRRRVGTVASIVTSIFDEYRIPTDLSSLSVEKAAYIEDFDQPRGTKDWEVLRSLANAHDAEVLIEWRTSQGPYGMRTVPGVLSRQRGHFSKPQTQGSWWGVFRDPPRTAKEAWYKFRYGPGDGTPISEIALEWGFSDQVSEIAVMYFDKNAKAWKTVNIEEDIKRQKDVYKSVYEKRALSSAEMAELSKQKKLHGKGDKKYVNQADLPTAKRDPFTSGKLHDVRVKTGRKIVRRGKPGVFDTKGAALTAHGTNGDGEIIDVTPLKVAAGGYSVEVVPDRKFKSAADALRWAAAWFRASKSAFVSGDLSMPGLESLKAGSVHSIAGIGERYSGDWYFPLVRHTITAGNGYVTTANIRKIVE